MANVQREEQIKSLLVALDGEQVCSVLAVDAAVPLVDEIGLTRVTVWSCPLFEKQRRWGMFPDHRGVQLH